MKWYYYSILNSMSGSRDRVSLAKDTLYNTSNISILNTKLDNVLEYYYAAVKNDAPKVDTAVYPGTYKLNPYASDFYIEKARNHLYNAICNMDTAISNTVDKIKEIEENED